MAFKNFLSSGFLLFIEYIARREFNQFSSFSMEVCCYNQGFVDEHVFHIEGRLCGVIRAYLVRRLKITRGFCHKHGHLRADLFFLCIGGNCPQLQCQM